MQEVRGDSEEILNRIENELFTDYQSSDSNIQLLDDVLTQILHDSNQERRDELSHFLQIWSLRISFVDALYERSEEIKERNDVLAETKKL